MNPHDARNLAWELMARHALTGWRFEFDHARRRFGSCRYGQKRITLSRPLTLLNAEDQVRDTLLHEIAHALAPGDGHGAVWRRKCREVGAKPQRCYTDSAVRSPPRRAAPYTYGCQACGWWVERRRLAENRYVCARCKGQLLYREKDGDRLFSLRRSTTQDLVRVFQSQGVPPGRAEIP
jgi:predicted SprT family Zn-dependent metalloprotease